MQNKIALAFCVHHKPWLMMSTLLTTVLQGVRNVDIVLIYHLGDGACVDKESYAPYHALAKKYDVNPQLSPYDERVRDICHVNGFNVHVMEFENDHLLDSGAWIKYLKTKHWEQYDYVICMQEGNLFTSSHVLSSMLDMAKKHSIDFLSAGHEKQQLPKSLVDAYNTRGPSPSEIDYYHDEKMQETFNLFRRDKKFAELYDAWGECEMITQNHVPLTMPHPLSQKLWSIARAIKRGKGIPVFTHTVHENTFLRPLRDLVPDCEGCNGVIYHKANEFPWFGCSCQHLFSHAFLKTLAEKFDEHALYDIIDVPFSGTAMEIVWGFIPTWLGMDKWFFDGFHRVRKNFVTYKREDDQEGMCNYINAYFKNIVHVVPEGDYIRIDSVQKKYAFIKELLPKDYFC